MKIWSTSDQLSHVDLNGNFSETVGDIGWQRISSTIVSTSIAAVVLSLTGAYDRYRVEWESVSPSATGLLVAQISQDNAVSFMSGPTSYTAAHTGFDGTTSVGASGSGTSISLEAISAIGARNGYLELDPYSFQADARGNAPLTAVWTRCDVAASWAGTSRPTHVAFLFGGGASIVGGRFRLLGARF